MIEGAGGIRQFECTTLIEGNPRIGKALTGIRDERRARIYANDLRLAIEICHRLNQRSGATPNVENSIAIPNPSKLREQRGQPRTPATHKSVIRGRVREHFWHVIYPSENMRSVSNPPLGNDTCDQPVTPNEKVLIRRAAAWRIKRVGLNRWIQNAMLWNL
jgi:hypothetical protein